MIATQHLWPLQSNTAANDILSSLPRLFETSIRYAWDRNISQFHICAFFQIYINSYSIIFLEEFRTKIRINVHEVLKYMFSVCLNCFALRKILPQNRRIRVSLWIVRFHRKSPFQNYLLTEVFIIFLCVPRWTIMAIRKHQAFNRNVMFFWSFITILHLLIIAWVPFKCYAWNTWTWLIRR